MSNYVYIHSESNLHTVGFYDPEGNWQPESDHSEQEKAAERAHFLNGGNNVLVGQVAELVKANAELQRRLAEMDTIYRNLSEALEKRRKNEERLGVAHSELLAAVLQRYPNGTDIPGTTHKFALEFIKSAGMPIKEEPKTPKAPTGGWHEDAGQ